MMLMRNLMKWIGVAVGVVVIASSVEACKRKKSKHTGGKVEQQQTVVPGPQNTDTDKETIVGNARVWKSADGRFEIKAEPYRVTRNVNVVFTATKCDGSMNWKMGDGSADRKGSTVQYAYNRINNFKVVGQCTMKDGVKYEGTLTIEVYDPSGNPSSQNGPGTQSK